MAHTLTATILPKLDNYEELVDRADARTIATAAFRAGHQGEWGDDDATAEEIWRRVGDDDESVIDLIAATSSAVHQIRAAAKNGARIITQFEYHAFVYDAALLGGPDCLVVGGIDVRGDGLFDGFEDVTVLAAILAQRSS
ncbi:hypothetical protein [Nocardia wallacei]|uniref:hypothetical protein n=1 Tax=Nocardia wallacei TaxID=480035 RepID=UPI002457C4C0|nr:hypothetical protein [Nocardia wallacei]